MNLEAILDKQFHFKERKTSLGQEFLGGFTTFLAMAYIIAVSPAMLSSVGVPFNAALTATCFGAAITTILMGLIVNRPLALATGVGIVAIVAFTLCANMGIDWRVAMSIVFVEGLLILLLVLCGLREAIMKAIPVDLRRAIGIGIGFFIALIGFKGGGIVVADPATFITMGDVTAPHTILAIISILIAVVLYARGVNASFLISIIVATIIGIPLGVTHMPTSFDFVPDFSSFGAPFQQTQSGHMAIIELFTMPTLLVFVFALMMSDFFDTMGVIVAVGNQGDFCDKEGNVENIKTMFTVDSLAAVAGGFIGCSSITTYLESASGAAAGARTGFSNIIVGVLFAICAFLAPVVGMISESATCGALVVVGYLMMCDIANIKWNDPALAFASFIIIATIPLTYSIANGIGLGFVSYVIIRIAQGKAKEVHPLMWLVALAFALSFIFM